MTIYAYLDMHIIENKYKNFIMYESLYYVVPKYFQSKKELYKKWKNPTPLSGLVTE